MPKNEMDWPYNCAAIRKVSCFFSNYGQCCLVCRAEHTMFKDWVSAPASRTFLWLKGVTRKGNMNNGPKKELGKPGKYDGSIIDAPWIIHAPKLIIWYVF